MRRLFWAFVMSIIAVLPAAAADQPSGSAPVATKGAMLHSADGVRLGEVDRVETDGSVQLIFDGRIVTVPATTLSLQDGELTTSLKKTDVMNLK
jgi:hypothetical protein